MARSDSDGNRASNGRFLPGHAIPGPGRRRRRTVHEIAGEFAARDGIDLEAAVWSILQKLIELAKGGDVVAARIVLDALCADASDAFEQRLADLEERLLR